MRCVYSNGWDVEVIVDDDGHLNIYIERKEDKSKIYEIETGQGDGNGEQLAIRITTDQLEKKCQILEIIKNENNKSRRN